MPTRRIDKDEKPYLPVPCFSKEHEPPSHMAYQPGKYEHTCPDCGHVIIFTVEPISLNINLGEDHE
jgi:hypothetical protein